MTGQTQNVAIFSASATGDGNHFPLTLYDNTIFSGNSSGIIEVQYSSSSSQPLAREHCLSYCLTTQTCDSVFITYKSGSNKLDWCRFYRIGLTLNNFVTLQAGIPELSLEPWSSLWSGGNGIPGSSELMVIGKRVVYVMSFAHPNF